MRFIHTADIHLGKTYRNSPGEKERYEDFFRTLKDIVHDAIEQQVDFFLICGDLFHTGQILPRTFAKTIETLQPLKDAGIPCIAIEGNHDWIHRRHNISWMEALSEMGYIRLLRPERTDEGGYRFEPFDEETGTGGRITIGDINIYGLGYIGAQAGSHVERICNAVATVNNLLLFHVGIWQYSPVEIGNMNKDDAYPLAEKFSYVALGHGHKPYTIETGDGKPFAFNPGAPERVNFGEEKYDKGYYLVTAEAGHFTAEFKPTDPRPMFVLTANLDGAQTTDEAFGKLRLQMRNSLPELSDSRSPLVEIKLAGRVGFHPFEMGREHLRLVIDELAAPLHVEVKNHLSVVSQSGKTGTVQKSLAEIESDVLRELISSNSRYQGREEELASLSMAIRDMVLKGNVEDDELLELFARKG